MIESLRHQQFKTVPAMALLYLKTLPRAELDALLAEPLDPGRRTMNRLIKRLIILAALLSLPATVQADAPTQKLVRGMGQLQAAMVTPGETYIATGSDLGWTIELLLRARKYVCDPALLLHGMGSFERGRYAKVNCLGGGRKVFVYRLELWADGETFEARPWIVGIDD